jgi:hypothetical protein
MPQQADSKKEETCLQQAQRMPGGCCVKHDAAVVHGLNLQAQVSTTLVYVSDEGACQGHLLVDQPSAAPTI